MHVLIAGESWITQSTHTLIAVREADAGRSAVFTSDCAPHRAPPVFCEDRHGDGPVFQALLGWTAGQHPAPVVSG